VLFSVFWQVRLVIWLYIVALYLLVVREQLHSAFWATKLVLEEVYEIWTYVTSKLCIKVL